MINVEEYLNKFFRKSKNPSLKAMRYFINKYDNFDKKMKFIHVAGTNGKGSCVEIISNILIKQGYKVGKFISPHLIRYNERISINGKDISDKEMSEIIEELEPLIKIYNQINEIHVTLFELFTIMALLYFYRNNVDFVVLETGLGGLYDCTNIIEKPIVSVITSIGYDHMHILGNTLSEIAYQKAGIIKNNSNTVIFEQSSEIDNVFINECKLKNNNLNIVKRQEINNYSYNDKFQYFDYKDLDRLCINLKGRMQVQNACLCIEVIKILNRYGYSIDPQNIRIGLSNVIHKGRMEEINTFPKVIYDGAHNEPAIKNVREMVDMYYEKFPRVYIVSILKRKDYKKILELLAQDSKAIFILTSGNDDEKYISNNILFEYMKKFVREDRIYSKDLRQAVIDAVNVKNNNLYLIVGSFYIYSTVIEELERLKKESRK